MENFKQQLERMEQFHKLFANGKTADQIVERAKELGLTTHPDDAREIDLLELIYRDVMLNEELESFEIIKFCRKYNFNPIAFEDYLERYRIEYKLYKREEI